MYGKAISHGRGEERPTAFSVPEADMAGIPTREATTGMTSPGPSGIPTRFGGLPLADSSGSAAVRR